MKLKLLLLSLLLSTSMISSPPNKPKYSTIVNNDKYTISWDHRLKVITVVYNDKYISKASILRRISTLDVITDIK